jgi:hypothetical protein
LCNAHKPHAVVLTVRARSAFASACWKAFAWGSAHGLAGTQALPLGAAREEGVWMGGGEVRGGG